VRCPDLRDGEGPARAHRVAQLLDYLAAGRHHYNRIAGGVAAGMPTPKWLVPGDTVRIGMTGLARCYPRQPNRSTVSETDVQEVLSSESADCHVCDLRLEWSRRGLDLCRRSMDCRGRVGRPRLVHGDAQSAQRRMVLGLSDQEAATLGPRCAAWALPRLPMAGAERVYMMDSARNGRILTSW